VLIINADDLGASTSATDAAIEAFRAGVISSASAMVWMGDSPRAARLVGERGLPVGLHLNLTLPFNSPAVPAAARERQLLLVKSFGRESWREDAGDGPPRELVRAAVQDQFRAFLECYGEPTHLDGHHHVHVHEAVLDVLPRGIVIRPILREPGSTDAPAGRRERRLHKTFQTPEVTLDFVDLHPALGGVGLAPLERALTDCVEVMCHPQQPAQLQALMSAEWRALIARLPVGSFAVLSRTA
jgi:chitin disaccharide deacetylase